MTRPLILLASLSLLAACQSTNPYAGTGGDAPRPAARAVDGVDAGDIAISDDGSLIVIDGADGGQTDPDSGDE